jgi:hypothetical protein
MLMTDTFWTAALGIIAVVLGTLLEPVKQLFSRGAKRREILASRSEEFIGVVADYRDHVEQVRAAIAEHVADDVMRHLREETLKRRRKIVGLAPALLMRLNAEGESLSANLLNAIGSINRRLDGDLRKTDTYDELSVGLRGLDVAIHEFARHVWKTT